MSQRRHLGVSIPPLPRYARRLQALDLRRLLDESAKRDALCRLRIEKLEQALRLCEDGQAGRRYQFQRMNDAWDKAIRILNQIQKTHEARVSRDEFVNIWDDIDRVKKALDWKGQHD
tara:strand:- start:143 stop:493 length:351 start_codon:yes stop_codon:yes gene_type:complete